MSNVGMSLAPRVPGKRRVQKEALIQLEIPVPELDPRLPPQPKPDLDDVDRGVWILQL